MKGRGKAEEEAVKNARTKQGWADILSRKAWQRIWVERQGREAEVCK
jgi:hypothetical protein